MSVVFGEIIAEAAVRFGDREALIEDTGRTLTYAQLHHRSDAIAHSLRRAGVGEGSVVAITHGSGIDYLLAFAAAAKLGATTAGINPSLAEPERERLLRQLQPDLVVAAPIDLGGSVTPRLEPVDDDPERVVAIVFTSGTTGLPKGAVFRNRQLESIMACDLGNDWRERWDGGGHMLVSTQMAHVGFMTKIPWYLRTGATMHVLAKWRPEPVLRLIDKYRIRSLGVVAPQLALLLRHQALDDIDVSCVDTIIAGGAASPSALVREATERFGAKYSIRYSSTESGGIGLATAFDASAEEMFGTVGRARPGVQVRVIGDDHLPVPTGTVGQLCIKTPTGFDRYWRNPEATASTLIDGWIHTGDLASVDDSGLVRLSGRLKEMYIRGGYNVAPAEVEAVLCDHPLVAEIAIAPRTDPMMGEIGVAIVRPSDPAHPPTLETLREFGASELAAWKLPEALVITDSLPLTAMQKLDRTELARLAATR